MKFEHDGAQYRIVFKREQQEPPIPTGRLPPIPVHKPMPMRMQTQVQLFQVVGTRPDGKSDMRELGRATVRGYFKDDISREEGRRKALQHLTPFIADELRPLMWQSYLNRPRQKAKD